MTLQQESGQKFLTIDEMGLGDEKFNGVTTDQKAMLAEMLAGAFSENKQLIQRYLNNNADTIVQFAEVSRDQKEQFALFVLAIGESLQTVRPSN